MAPRRVMVSRHGVLVSLFETVYLIFHGLSTVLTKKATERSNGNDLMQLLSVVEILAFTSI